MTVTVGTTRVEGVSKGTDATIEQALSVAKELVEKGGAASGVTHAASYGKHGLVIYGGKSTHKFGVHFKTISHGDSGEASNTMVRILALFGFGTSNEIFDKLRSANAKTTFEISKAARR